MHFINYEGNCKKEVDVGWICLEEKRYNNKNRNQRKLDRKNATKQTSPTEDCVKTHIKAVNSRAN